MKIETSTNAKLHFGRLLENSLKEPIVIKKSGRKVAVILSFEEYQRISALEDSYWMMKAEKSEAEGFMSAEETEKLMERLLNAKD